MRQERQSNGRNQDTTFLIVDAQSVNNTDTAELKGYDAGKKVLGIKRHISVDTQGLPHFIEITTANETDRKGALQGIENHKRDLNQVSALHTFALIPQRRVAEQNFAWLEKCRQLWKNCERLLNSSLHRVALAFIQIFTQ